MFRSKDYRINQCLNDIKKYVSLVMASPNVICVHSASSIWLFLTMRFGNRDFQICYGRIYISRFAWEMRLQSGGIWKLPLMRCGV